MKFYFFKIASIKIKNKKIQQTLAGLVTFAHFELTVVDPWAPDHRQK